MAVLQDPTIDLRWTEYQGAIHEIFSRNAQQFPDRECVVETGGRGMPKRAFTYHQINHASDQLAGYLLQHGCQVGDVVMIYAYRGVDLVVAYMGALKAGATVSVLDPQYPAERQKVLLDVARPSFLISIQKANEESGKPSDTVMEFVSSNLKIKATIPALQLCDDGSLQGGDVDGKDDLRTFVPDANEIASVLVGPDTIPTLSFTSGSEGRPKGVQGRHFSLTHYFPWMAKRFGLSEKDRFTMLSGIAHDPIQRDIFTPLFLGATLVVPPADVITYEVLAEWMGEYELTVTHLTPAMGQILVGGASARFPSLRNAFFVGDLLTKKDCRKLQELAQNTAIINLYGSTESQRSVSFFEILSRSRDPNFLESMPDIIPVGQGMQNVQLLVVDREDKSRLCEVGEQGELFIRAGGLAEGYLGQDTRTVELNKSKFLSNWFVDPAKWIRQYEDQGDRTAQEPWRKLFKGPRDRVYRTGDLGRLRPDGNVECTGRVDLQVKIRGFRVELGDIDANLSQHPFVRDNVTVVRRDKDEEQTLVTYFVPETRRWFEHLEQSEGKRLAVPDLAEESISAMLRRFKSLSEDCKRFLAEKLPRYAVPSILIPLARMPLNPNGKVDRPALPFPDASDLAQMSKRRSSSVAVNMTDTQARLAKIWAQVLPNRTARMFVPESNFFNEGGHSILAQQLFFHIRKEWSDSDLPVRLIFQSQTIEALAAEIDRTQDPIGLRLDTLPLPGDAAAKDEAYAADAMELVNQLPKVVKGPAMEIDQTAASLTVLLTGATGFLGSYVLHELLKSNPKIRVIVHIRSEDASAGLARLRTISEAHSLWSQDWVTADRLEVVPGDISKSRLGLSGKVWDRLAEEVDVIIHNGAQVNWMLPYSSLRAANVLSTMACIQLCCTKKPKRLTFVSSTAVLDNDHYVQLTRKPGSVVTERDDLEGSRKGLVTGYGQSKWASEFIVREAGRRGLVGAIVRPGYITGDPRSGIQVTDDFLVRLWKGCIQVGARPDIANSLNAVPVTQVSRIVTASALHLPSVIGQSCGVTHVTGHPRLSLNDWMDALESYGYDVPMVPYKDWCSKVQEYVGNEKAAEAFALLPLFHFVVGNLPVDTITPEMDDSNTAGVLERYLLQVDHGRGLGDFFAASSMSERTLGMYLAYLVAVGFQGPPPSQGRLSLPAIDQASIQAFANGQLGGRATKS